MIELNKEDIKKAEEFGLDKGHLVKEWQKEKYTYLDMVHFATHYNNESDN